MTWQEPSIPENADYEFYFHLTQGYAGVMGGNHELAPGHEFNRKYALDKLTKWKVDQDRNRGQLVFSFEDDPVLECDVQIAGTYELKSQEWRWSWANDSINDRLIEGASKTRKWGLQHGGIAFGSHEELFDRIMEISREKGELVTPGFSLLTTPDIKCDEMGALSNAAFVSYLTRAKGLFVGEDGGRQVYLVITDYRELD